jgi:hypothetical protein
VTLPTRIGENSSTATDTIFLDISKHDNSEVQPLHSGLSGYEVQLITKDIVLGHSKNYQTVFQRQINKYRDADFQLQLNYKTWDTVFKRDDVNKIFNSF